MIPAFVVVDRGHPTGFRASAAAPDPARVIRAEALGVVADDGLDDAGSLLDALAELPPHEPVVIELPAGELRFEQPLVITRGDVVLRGRGPARTRIISAFSRDFGDDADAAIVVRGERGPAWGRTLHRNPEGRSTLVPEKTRTENAPAWVWVGAPNDDEFFDLLGSQVWRRPYPWLRQAILPVDTSSDGVLFLRKPLPLELPAGAVIRAPRMLARVGLESFSLYHEIPGHAPESVRGVFENAHPGHLIDGVRFEWSRESWIEDVEILMSGRGGGW